MVFALLLLILQWAVGMLVLILCFVERRRFSAEIVSKLGSSFSLAPFIIVVAVCTLLAMVATLPVAQLFFFHILLIKKGISTYDYIIALREQDQEQEQLAVGGQQSPQMSQVSSFTGLSSTSSFNQFHRGAWCTPPRLFLEDQVSYFHYLESYCECNLPWFDGGNAESLRDAFEIPSDHQIVLPSLSDRPNSPPTRSEVMLCARLSGQAKLKDVAINVTAIEELASRGLQPVSSHEEPQDESDAMPILGSSGEASHAPSGGATTGSQPPSERRPIIPVEEPSSSTSFDVTLNKHKRHRAEPSSRFATSGALSAKRVETSTPTPLQTAASVSFDRTPSLADLPQGTFVTPPVAFMSSPSKPSKVKKSPTSIRHPPSDHPAEQPRLNRP
ncbi:probable protein S-acyltransferase 22 [Zingiber officinale]|uniref:probable protein S-acyltransferase 22 n=1 Tax=Zingiber officinale TaxID=94328 RepID=UPI001C4C0CB8|nr:probable protein S-acyltransferase 22 [Zingiber officinale]